MQGRRRRTPRGFTLVEMLVVIAIIAVLGGMLMGALSYARKKSMIDRTTNMCSSLEAALLMYETDFSDFPDSDGEDGLHGNEMLLEKLTSEEKDGPYLKDKRSFNFSDLDGNGMKEIADAWGQPFHYVHRRHYGREAPNRRTYRLYSAGPDREFDPFNPRSDDIVNWHKTEDLEE